MRRMAIAIVSLVGFCFLGTSPLSAQQPTLIVPLPPAPSKLPPQLTVMARGEFVLGSVAHQISHMTQDRKQVEQSAALTVTNNRSRLPEGQYAIDGTLKTSRGDFKLVETITAVDSQTFIYETSVKSDIGIDTFYLGLQAKLPLEQYRGHTMMVDGQPVVLPETKAKASAILHKPGIKTVMFGTPNGYVSVEGPSEVLIRDDRHFGSESFTVRWYFTPGRESVIRDAKLKLKVTFTKTVAGN